MKEKTHLSHEVVCFQMLDFETSDSKSEVSKSNSWKTTSFSKTRLLQREPFLTKFYTREGIRQVRPHCLTCIKFTFGMSHDIHPLFSIAPS